MATKKKAAKKPFGEIVNLKLTRDEARRLRDVLEVVHLNDDGSMSGGAGEVATLKEAEIGDYQSVDWVVFNKLMAVKGL